MASDRKKLAQAIERLETYPKGKPLSLYASRVKEVHTLLFDIIEAEQEFRRTMVLPRFRNPGTLSEISDANLAAHKGWAARVIDSANAIINKDYQTSQEADVLDAICSNAVDRLLEKKSLFVTKPRDSLFSRLVYLSYKGYQRLAHYLKLWRAKRTRRYETQGADLEVAKLLEDSFLDFKPIKDQRPAETATSALDAFASPGAPTTGMSAVNVIPENAGINGVTCVVCKDTKEVPSERNPEIKVRCPRCGCENKICYGGYVYGERWGSEDYPCPKCNRAEYDEWLKKTHPEEVLTLKVDDATKEQVEALRKEWEEISKMVPIVDVAKIPMVEIKTELR